MKTTGSILGLGLLLLAGTTAAAGQEGLQPVPEVPVYSAPAAPIYGGPAHYGHQHQYEYQEVELYNRVKYKDHDEMAPCAVTKVIQVNNPHRRGHCYGPDCVFVEICVPGGVCERVKVSKGGDRIRYDYGDYKVDVRVKKGYVEVDYQD